MSKNKKIIIIIVLIIALIGIGVILWGSDKIRSQKFEELLNISQPAKSIDKKMILYYGAGSAPSQAILDLLKQEEFSKLKYTAKEIWKNEANMAEFKKIAEGCKLDSKNAGVPLLFAEDKCLVGQLSVVEYLRQKAEKR